MNFLRVFCELLCVQQIVCELSQRSRAPMTAWVGCAQPPAIFQLTWSCGVMSNRAQREGILICLPLEQVTGISNGWETIANPHQPK